MVTESAKQIFDEFNPAQDVVQCPNGKAKLRNLLDSYAMAATNLYGIITREDFVELFNTQNDDKTSPEEIFRLLLPLVLKNAPYGFYKNYLVDSSFFKDFSRADDLAEHQADKPRYSPEKEEFLQYVNEGYSGNDSLKDLKKYLWSEFGYGPKTAGALEELMNLVILGDQLHELGPIMNRHDLVFSGENKLEEFMELVLQAKDNTRIWENKGYTPDELFKLTSQDKADRSTATLKPRTKVGRNDPCPCGSGKKFKKCCGLYDDTKTAHLSEAECREFCELWFGLMGYVNDREHVIREKIKPDYPNTVSDIKIYEVRKVLWEKPQLIDEYISQSNLSQDKIDILKLWQTNHKKSILFLVEYQPEFAVALTTNEQGQDTLYGIKGISTSLANSFRLVLPTPIETVLLPFKGKIIYDSFITSMESVFPQSDQKSIREMYDRVKEQGIITSLE